MKANRLTLLVSILAIVLSVIAISTSLPQTEMSFDYLGFITGSLGFLVTVLLGWNIYTIFDFRQERQDLKAYFDEQKQSVKAVGSDLRRTFKNQIANVSLLEKHISDVNSYNFVFYSVPTDNGFTAYVDGKQTLLHQVNLGLSSVFVPKGKYEVQFKFMPAGMKEGMMASVAMLVILLLVGWNEKIKLRKEI